MLKIFTFLFILGIIFLSCQSPPKEQEIKTEIVKWWGIEDNYLGILATPIDVYIEDIQQEKNSIRVLARFVLLGDTLNRITYEFEKFSKGWKISKDPVDQFTKIAFLDGIENFKLSKLKDNMYHLQIAVEDWASRTGFAAYPLDFETKVSDVLSSSTDSSTVLSLLPQNMLNPYHYNEPAIIVGQGSIYAWDPDYSGRVVYFLLKRKAIIVNPIKFGDPTSSILST